MAHAVEVKRVTVEVKTFPGLGKRIKNARESDPRSLSQICREAEISRGYWYQLENEELLSPATEEIIRKVEAALGVDLKVSFGE
ncbi:MAG: helix-turn-helix transcriptional regulator [Cyanobacteria bacterium J06642_11]